jgi:hypothetical protein
MNVLFFQGFYFDRILRNGSAMFRFWKPVAKDIFVDTWMSTGSGASTLSIDRNNRSFFYMFGCGCGRIYARLLAEQVARDRTLAAKMRQRLYELRQPACQQDEMGNPCIIRTSSFQRIGGLMPLLPSVMARGFADSIARYLPASFPRKGERPHPNLGFNFYVAGVEFDSYGGDRHSAYRRKDQIEILFEIEVDS